MKAQIAKWGNSQGIRFPKAILQDVGLSINDTVRMYVKEGKIIIEKAARHRSLEERAAEFGGELGPYNEYDWGDPAGREVW